MASKHLLSCSQEPANGLYRNPLSRSCITFRTTPTTTTTTTTTAWCKTLLEKLIVTHPVKKYPAFFMKPEGLLPYSQKPAIRPYPEPAKSSSPHRTLSP
jgi:hypothetical protein